MKKKVLLVGQCGDYPERGYRAVQAFTCRDIELLVSAHKLGYDCYLLGQHDKTIRDGTIQCVHWDNLGPVEEYDGVILSEFHGHAKASIDHPRKEEFRSHPNVAVVLDQLCDYGWSGPADLAYCRVAGIGWTNPLANYRQFHPGQDSFLLPWGYMDIPQELDPYPRPSLPIIVYVGAVQARFVEIFNAIAETGKYSMWVGGLHNLHGGWSGVTDEEWHQLYHERVYCLTDILPKAKEDESCALIYGEFFSAYQWADVGLNLMPFAPPTAYNSKVYDMLSGGLPVVSESQSVNNADILHIRGGEVVPLADTADLLDGIDAALTWAPMQRDRIRQEALGLGTWDDRARTLLSHLFP